MISIRTSIFETNSSSVHALVIPKDTKITIPNRVSLYYGEYGWEQSVETDTLDYIYTACVDRGQEEVDKLISYLKRKGVEEINILSSNDNGNYGIDHGYDVPLAELFANENLLDRFLFGYNSYVQTGNDNDGGDYMEDGYYNEEEYDVLWKEN